MRRLDLETNVTVKFGDLKELQEIWWGFGGLEKVLKLIENDQDIEVYHTVKPLFDRLEALCFDGPLDANLIETRLVKRDRTLTGRPVENGPEGGAA